MNDALKSKVLDENISDKDVPGPSTNKKGGGGKAAVAMVTIPKYRQHEHRSYKWKTILRVTQFHLR